VAQKLTTLIDLTHPSLIRGLTSEEAEKRLKLYGKNVITPPKEEPSTQILIIYLIQDWKKFLKHCVGGLELLLLFASILSFISYTIQKEAVDWICGIVLVGVVLLGATLAYV
jgi:magnesium-transporting ATPase (P-type)